MRTLGGFEDVRTRAEQMVSFVSRRLQEDQDWLCDLDDFSLASGTTGVALFGAYVRRWNPTLFGLDALNRYMRHAIDRASRELNTGFFFGPVGVAWTITHLSHDYHSELADNYCSIVDEFVLETLKSDSSWVQRYDLFSGLVGLGTYILERPDSEHRRQALDLAVIRLLEHAEDPGFEQMTWRAANRHNPYGPASARGPIYNLGVPHGVPGIVSFLARALQRLPKHYHALSLTMNWLLAQRISGTYPSFGMIASAPTPQWLQPAWCYGDLGIALAVANAAVAAKRVDWRKSAEALATNVAQQTMEGSLETGVCHGSAGNGHLFARLFEHFGLPVLREASTIWFGRALMRWDPARRDGFAGYKSDIRDQPLGSVGFLRGAAGTALCVLGDLGHVDRGWDRVILASG